MKITIHYRDDHQPTEFKHVAKISVSPNGFAYHLLNVNGRPIAIIPMDVVRSIRDVEADTDIELVENKVQLV